MFLYDDVVESLLAIIIDFIAITEQQNAAQNVHMRGKKEEISTKKKKKNKDSFGS